MGEIQIKNRPSEIEDSAEYLLQYGERAEKIIPYSDVCIDKNHIVGITGVCKESGCNAECCHLPVPITEQDIADGLSHKDGFLSKKEDGSCVYLEKTFNVCEIYSRRPLACRIYDCSKREMKDHSAKIVKGWRLKELLEINKTVRVVIGVPNEGHTPVEAYDNRMLMMYHLGKYEIESKGKFEFFFHTIGRLFVPMAREVLCERAVSLGADYVFMIDDDMIVPLDLFERLYSRNVDVVGALAFTRNPPHHPVMYTCIEGYDQGEYFINQSVLNYPKNSIVECDAIGFGAVLIKTDVLKKMKKPWFLSTSPSGEDILFCYSAKRAANARIYMDTSVKLGHVGSPKIITEETFEECNKDHDFKRTKGAYVGPGLAVLNGNSGES